MKIERIKKTGKAIWWAHGAVGKVLSIVTWGIIIAAVIGLPFGITRIAKADEMISSNIFLGESFELHDGNYLVTVNSARTTDEIHVMSATGIETTQAGHYAEISITVTQAPDSQLKPHAFDEDDFKLKGHTGVYLPLNDIAGLVGWDMLDVHWDKRENGFVIASADITTAKAVTDYRFVGHEISPGKTANIMVNIPISNKNCSVETSLMVLEIDFFVGGLFSQKRVGADVILLPRPEGLEASQNSELS